MKRIIILIAALAVLPGCFQDKNAELDPSETVEVFCRALTARDFDKAESLCDTLMMKEYMDGIRSVWGKADDSVADIVPAILSETVFEITDVIKNGQNRTVFYTLTAAGQTKEKAAALRKEEGAWKIESITDRH